MALALPRAARIDRNAPYASPSFRPMHKSPSPSLFSPNGTHHPGTKGSALSGRSTSSQHAARGGNVVQSGASSRAGSSNTTAVTDAPKSTVTSTILAHPRHPVLRLVTGSIPPIPPELEYIPYLDRHVSSFRRLQPMPKDGAGPSNGRAAPMSRRRSTQSHSTGSRSHSSSRRYEPPRAVGSILPNRSTGAPFDTIADDVVRTTDHESMRTSSIFDVRGYFWDNQAHEPDQAEKRMMAGLAARYPGPARHSEGENDVLVSVPPEMKALPVVKTAPTWAAFTATPTPPASPSSAALAASSLAGVRLVARPAKPRRPSLIPSAYVRLQYRLQHPEYIEKQARRQAVLNDIKGKRKLAVTVQRELGATEEDKAAPDPTPQLERKEEKDELYSAERVLRASGRRAARLARRSIGLQALEEKMAFEDKGRELGELRRR